MDIHADLHTHTRFSDGSSSVDEMVQASIKKGLATVAITDHMPLPYSTRYAMDINQVAEYKKEIRDAKEKYRDRIQVLAGMEIEFSPELKAWVKSIVDMGWEYLIVSVHSLFKRGKPCLVNGNRQEFAKSLHGPFNNDIRAVCRQYFFYLHQAFETGWFQTAAHLDVVKKHTNGLFAENEPWYRDQVLETLKVLQRQDMKMEINTSGLDQSPEAAYPSPWIIRQAEQMGIPMVLGSDSHSPDTLGRYFDGAVKDLG